MKLPNKSHLTANNSPNSIYVKTFFSDLEGKFTRIGDFTWRVSDCEELSGSLLGECLTCEELVGVTHRRCCGWFCNN